ncbi:hypothetical protein AC578_5689 [Pseudocercospora eumusae]|uniref:TEA domain-containing protein n=1 Tax=Pseudocercospora eumusae TaxID=321146 RepID=A0A139HEN8_9PEZI|nr:hypothetical protein AC578_5689 [Pseudocercospora eumusae]KXT00898.1 hypothetical protein AC578_5689 [Pseudocercospora eumusae]
MLQPTQVLPSNAPPLQESPHHLSRTVLQEHSGNRQQNDYSYQQHATDLKYPPSIHTENTYAGLQQAYRPAHVYQQTPAQRNALRYGARRTNPWATEQAIEKEASYLYQRFRNSDQYTKYRNRQHKDDKGGQEQKWPDRLEFAFCKALVRWPPMGKRKLLHKEKLKGRNELISDAIEEETGEARGRKQVSSHIQVLKPFVKGDAHLMRYLSNEDLGRDRHRMYSGSHHSVYQPGRRMSGYPVVVPPYPVRSAGPIMSPAHHHSLAHLKGKLEIFEPTDFQMFVQRKVDDDNVERLHTYTASITTPRQPEKQSPDWTKFNQDFPLLALMHSKTPLDCDILLAEASIAFPTESFKQDKDRVELGISFMCKSRHLPPNAQVICQNSFYRNGTLLKEYGGIDRVPMTQDRDGEPMDTQVKFGSAFWARTLAHLAGRLKDDSDTAKDAREEVDNYIRGITASQEIVLKIPGGIDRLLVIYWQFRLSTGNRGRAYWMPLKLPPASTPTAYEVEPKSERVDSVYDNYTLQTSYTTNSQDPYAVSQPSTLQSPFEYDNTSSSAGSATWPAHPLDNGSGGINTAPQSAVDTSFPDNAFDFSGGNINISYDPNIMDFSNFDTEAFNFDTGTADFATDPALQDFTTADASQNQTQQTEPSIPNYPQQQSYDWCDDYASFNSQSQQQVQQAPMSAGASPRYAENYDYSLPTTVNQSQSQPSAISWDHYDTHYDQSWQQSQQEGQAYGGAGIKEEDSLAALADASNWAAHQSQTQGGAGAYHAE